MDRTEQDVDRRRGRADALIASAGASARGVGRLKIFLGAAPGVGKTYEMLLNAQARKHQGVDVVVGVVETHGRADTSALLEGLEMVSRTNVSYKGQTLDEMDLDAILKRRPSLVLVDEFAHTNAPGSRHPKRYLDVEELLDAGIDVHTTLNIQHVESLNDVVARITRIRVRETVPDRMLDRADDIELIDLTPDDLIRRLQDGKVYVGRHAERAQKHYFTPQNLTALRELALRRTAQRVDEQLLIHMQSNAIAGPWAAGDRIIVCVSEDPRSAGLVRYGKRLADRLHAPWTALSVETRRSLQLSEADRDRLAATMRLAQSLGGEIATLPGVAHRIADDVLAFAHENNATQIVVGKSNRSRLFELINGSVVHDLVRRAGGIGVHVVPGEDRPGDALPKPVAAGTQAKRPDPAGYLWATLAVGFALAFAWNVQPIIGLESIDLIFLSAVLGIAVRYGLWPSLLATVLSSLAYNFFFLPPLYTFTIADPTNVAALFFFALVAVLVSNLAARARLQTLAAQSRARTTEALYSFSRKLSGSVTLDDVLWASAYQIASMLRVHVVLLLPAGGSIAVRAGYPPEDTLEDADLAAARWAFEHAKAAGRDADTLPGARRLFLPMRTGRGMVGVVGLDKAGQGPLLTPEHARLLDALVDQSALAIERVRLVEDLDRARLAEEADRLRQALLTSISHDLKTPLAAILGAAGTVRDLDAALEPASRTDLLDTIVEESERLNRFIANLLDMTRIEAGAIAPKITMQDLNEIVSTALDRSARVLMRHRVETSLGSTLPAVRVDPILLEQAIFNLLDNAAKYAPVATRILIETRAADGQVLLRVTDEGPGIPTDDLERVFDKFHRVTKTDTVRAGTGLGLPIARGFVEFMGGTVTADCRTDQIGAILTIALPVAKASA